MGAESPRTDWRAVGRLPQSSEGGNRAQPVALGFVSQHPGFAGITHGAEETDIEEADPYATRSVSLCTVA